MWEHAQVAASTMAVGGKMREEETGLTRPNSSWRDVRQRGRQDTPVVTDKTEATETSKAGKDMQRRQEKADKDIHDATE